MRRPRIAACLLPLVVVVGCASSSSPAASSSGTGGANPSPSPSSGAQGPVLFALGDSIPFNAEDDCPGCIGLVDGYANLFEAQTGQPMTVLNRSRHDGARTADILEQVQTDEAFLAELATADTVIMSVGFNDQPPFADAHDGCPEPVGESDPLDVAIARAAATSQQCIDAAVAAIRGQIAEVFTAVRAKVGPEIPMAALTAYDTWRGWDALDSLDEATRDDLYAAELYWFHQWRDAMCAEAEKVGAACIDVYSAFNGADGTEAAAEFVGADYTHPNQEGNDAIRDLLIGPLPIPIP